MTLQRRLLLLLLIGAPMIWLATVGYSAWRARQEIDELFDTQQVRLAQQVLALLPSSTFSGRRPGQSDLGDRGVADLRDLSIAVWDAHGTLLLADREGATLAYRPLARGFVDADLEGRRWRVYYLHAADAALHVAVGQSSAEREELARDLLLSQLVPWLLVLPALLAVITAGVRHALKPVHALAHDIAARRADDLQPITAPAPAELQPLVHSMTALFARIATAIDHERRMTADAAHELRTPLAALRAQWEAAEASRLAADETAYARARRQVGLGIERLSHLVEQLLTLARAEGATSMPAAAVDWPRVMQQALSDCLPLIESTGSEVEVEWPPHGLAPLPLLGDTQLLATLLRNLIDNALRYGPPRAIVRVRFTSELLIVEDDGPGLAPEVLARLGDRFFRPPGRLPPGSGLGVSIANRIAELHGLTLTFANRGEHGLRVELRRRPA